MTWKTLKYRLTGDAPVIFHNGQLANPLNKFAKEIKKISSKRKKTDADYEQMAEYEFKGGLYVDDDLRPIVPMEGVEAILVAGAKKKKEGQIAKAGAYCPKPGTLNYEGPKTADKLWENKKFRLVAPVKVKQATVMRTRPIFNEWSADIEIKYNDSMVNEDQVTEWLKIAGEQCGAFDWRPKYGRFVVKKIE